MGLCSSTQIDDGGVHHGVAGKSTGSGGTIIHLHRMLSEGERLRTTEFFPVTEFTHLTFTRVGVFLGVHLDVGRRHTTHAMAIEEGTVTTIQDVHLGIRQDRISMVVGGTIVTTNELGPASTKIFHPGQLSSVYFTKFNRLMIGRR